LQTKAELKTRKDRAAEIESLIRAEAELLDSRSSQSSLFSRFSDFRLVAGLQQTEEEALVAAELLRECEAMETEIAMLKNKRSPTEVLPSSLLLRFTALTRLVLIANHD
jgi:hypothetical protein